jgi:sec-independent protein translocase protein TatA
LLEIFPIFIKLIKKTMFGLGPKELVIIAAILVLLFGAKKIPELARGIRDAVREIKSGFSDEERSK